jgi:hypothetical protein
METQTATGRLFMSPGRNVHRCAASNAAALKISAVDFCIVAFFIVPSFVTNI